MSRRCHQQLISSGVCEGRCADHCVAEGPAHQRQHEGSVWPLYLPSDRRPRRMTRSQSSWCRPGTRQVSVTGDVHTIALWGSSSPATAERCPSGRSTCHRTGVCEQRCADPCVVPVCGPPARPVHPRPPCTSPPAHTTPLHPILVVQCSVGRHARGSTGSGNQARGLSHGGGWGSGTAEGHPA